MRSVCGAVLGVEVVAVKISQVWAQGGGQVRSAHSETRESYLKAYLAVKSTRVTPNRRKSCPKDNLHYITL